jgi:hypothetical protein
MKLALILDKCIELKEDSDSRKRWLEEREPNKSKLELIADVLKKHKPDLIVGPEYFFMDGKSALNPEGKNYVLKELKKISAGNKTIIIPGSLVYFNRIYSNSTIVICNGKIIKEIKKRAYSGFDEYFNGSSPKNHKTSGFSSRVENYLKARLIEINEIKILVEICADHPLTVKRSVGTKDSLPIKTPKVADLQIVISNEVDHHFTSPFENLFLKVGGYFIECNSEHPSSYAGRVTKGKMEDIYCSKEGIEEKVAIVEILF